MLRPIECGLTLRRLVAKVTRVLNKAFIQNALMPQQVGMAGKGGTETAVDASRASTGADGPLRALVKLDFRNTFNKIQRDVVLEKVKGEIPLFLPLVCQCGTSGSGIRHRDKAGLPYPVGAWQMPGVGRHSLMHSCPFQHPAQCHHRWEGREKIRKYTGLHKIFPFDPIALEAMGTISVSAVTCNSCR